MKARGNLIVISGFSGAGKGTVVKKLVEEYGYSLSISATTRAPRQGEVNGGDYYFISQNEFQNLIDYNGFIEWAKYVDNYYGTPRAFVEDEIKNGRDVILEIEVQGAMNVKEQYKDAILVFITAPDPISLKDRLVRRGTESEAAISKRLKRAIEEADDMENYDYIVINDQLEQCVEIVNSIIISNKCKKENNLNFIEETKKSLINL